MTIQELKKSYSRICSNLAVRRIKPAFDLINLLITENNLGTCRDEYLSLKETYDLMLKYTVEGIRDPERQKVYRRLIVSVYSLADKVNEALMLRYSPSVIYEKKRSFKSIGDIRSFVAAIEDFYLQDELPGTAQADTAAASGHLQNVKDFFNYLWFGDRFTPEDMEAVRNFMVSPVIETAYKSFVVTAVTLSLQRYFDRGKFDLLFEAYDTEEQEMKQRALVGLLINLYRYDARMPFLPSITGRLMILNESPDFKRNLERIIVQFIRSKETEKLQQRIRDELLPEMVKISPNLKDKINLDSLMEEGLTEDKNPDWEEIFKDSPGLLNKMEEFSELQMEGADVFMGSFAMLKTFPFYYDTTNWFIPFFTENPELGSLMDMNDSANTHLMEVIRNAPILCNSDKYSFCFSLQSIPRENREFLSKGLQAEMDQWKEIQEDDALLDPARKAEFVSNQYIQDLYRFYKLFPRRNDFEDIFSWRFDFHNKLALGSILKEDMKLLRNIGEYYFAKNHFDEAAEIYSSLLEEEKSGELYQKLAYCYQKQGNFEQALDNYLKAELYGINQLWNLKKIALCFRNLKNPAKALEYYQAADSLEPDSLNNQLNIGHCLLELDQYDEALKCYFRVEYLAPGNKKVWRPIAWCSFLTGKKEQAEKYYLKLMEEDPGKHDLMNMGHVQWSLGNRKAALDYYRQSVSPEGFSEVAFLEVFEEDLPHLVSQGVDSDDVPIMLDQLRYFLEE